MKPSEEHLDWRAWSGLVAAPVAWAIHHQVGSDLNFSDCRAGDGRVLVLVGLASLAIASLSGSLSFAAWRNAGGSRPLARFIPALGMMAAALFGLTILTQTFAAVVVPACFR